MTQEYDIIVVGAGLIGSAAARHLVEISKDVKVLLIGPEEPKVSVGSLRLSNGINKNAFHGRMRKVSNWRSKRL